LCSCAAPPCFLPPADANSIAQQALGNIRTVYAFNGEERTLEAYSKSLDEPVKVGGCQGVLCYAVPCCGLPLYGSTLARLATHLLSFSLRQSPGERPTNQVFSTREPSL